MHELPISENILNIALNHANNANANKITDIYLVIGQLSSFIDESIQFYWNIISKDTIAEGAELHFERIAAKFRCSNCYKSFTFDESEYICPYCDSLKIEIKQGREFYLDSIKIDS